MSLSQHGLPSGRYILPDNPNPTQLVVMFHGVVNDSCSWQNHIREAAGNGAVAVSLDYSGQVDQEVDGFGLVQNYGWNVRNGGADAKQVVHYFMNRFPSITEVFNFGTSMGGNVSGYAIYQPDAVRADCSPLWDFWVATEGVHNLTEEYQGIVLVAATGTNDFASLAKIMIEEENGGTSVEVPERYSEITNTANVNGMSSLRGVVLTHGTVDQTVPFDQSQQMSTALNGIGVPTHFYVVQGSDHVSETSSTEVVMRQGLDELARLMAGGTVTPGQTTLQNQ